MDETASGGWGVAAAAVGAALFASPYLARPDVALVLGALAFFVLLPFTTGAYRVARGSVGIEPTPLFAKLAGRSGALPPRWRIIPGVAVGVAILALAYNVLASPLFALLLGGATPKASPVLLSGPEFLVLNTITVTEEIAFRLGVLYLIAGLVRARSDGTRRPDLRAWIAIVVSGLLFGLMHVVNVGYYGFPLGPFVVFSLLSQGVSGIFFGYVGWRFGVEASWLTHITFNLLAFHLARLALGG